LLHQSYTGSRDMWGLHDADEDKRRGQSVPIYDDGKIEIIGLESAGKAMAAAARLLSHVQALHGHTAFVWRRAALLDFVVGGNIR
jgi:hypothetical protein